MTMPSPSRAMHVLIALVALPLIGAIALLGFATGIGAVVW